VPAIIAAISTAESALRKLSAAAPYEISAARCANSARANAGLRTAEPTADAAGPHTSSPAADLHPTPCAADTHATAGHATSAATAAAAATYVHAAAAMHPASAVHSASATSARLLREDRGCDC
jgi:hypothetical protein